MGYFIILLLGYGVYAFIVDIANDPDIEESIPEEVVTPVQSHSDGDYTITKKTYIIDSGGYRVGDTVYVDYYSDGYIERYYTDGESYVAD